MSQTPTLAFAKRGDSASIEQGAAFSPKFDADGLIPAIVTDHASGDVLMFAWMNAEALSASLTTRQAHFWSRSRAKLWKKGEDSGNVLTIEDMRTDCDQDALLVRVRVTGQGVACHTGARSCFYRSVTLGTASPGGSPLVRTET
jgi:phosphoribosyl-AMP cyclohydrolase